MRRRLVLVALATTSMVAIAFLVPLALLLADTARNNAIDDGADTANAFASFVTFATSVDDIATQLPLTEAGSENRVSVILPDGTVVGRPAELTDSIRLAQQGRSFTVSVDGGKEVLVPVVRRDGQIAVVRVLVPDSLLRKGVVRAWLVLAAVGALLVAGAVAVADRLAASIVRPVTELATTARRLGRGERDARVEPAGPPEIADVGSAVNELADRIDALILTEREEVADLSHRLRTPLTALRLDVERLDAGETTDRVLADTEALERAVDALIQEARRPIRVGAGARTDAVPVVRDRAEFWSALAEDQGRAWHADVPAPVAEVAVAAEDLEAALDALLGNVFDHTPDGVAVAIGLKVGAGVARLTIGDGGPGFADAAVVGRGVSRGGSTGLGLDIARRTAEAAGGRIEIGRSPLGGAEVAMVLPLATPPR